MIVYGVPLEYLLNALTIGASLFLRNVLPPQESVFQKKSLSQLMIKLPMESFLIFFWKVFKKKMLFKKNPAFWKTNEKQNWILNKLMNKFKLQNEIFFLMLPKTTDGSSKIARRYRQVYQTQRLSEGPE